MRRIFTGIGNHPKTHTQMHTRASQNNYAAAASMLRAANAALVVVDNTIRQQIINQALNPSYYPINPNTDSDILHHSYMTQERGIADDVSLRNQYQETGVHPDPHEDFYHPPPPPPRPPPPPPPPAARPAQAQPAAAPARVVPQYAPQPPVPAPYVDRAPRAPPPPQFAPPPSVHMHPSAPPMPPAPRSNPSAAHNRHPDLSNAASRGSSIHAPRDPDENRSSTSRDTQHARGHETHGMAAHALAAGHGEAYDRRQSEHSYTDAAVQNLHHVEHATTTAGIPIHRGAARNVSDAMQQDRGRANTAARAVQDNVGGPARIPRMTFDSLAAAGDIERDRSRSPPRERGLPRMPPTGPPATPGANAMYPPAAGISNPSIAGVLAPNAPRPGNPSGWGERRDMNFRPDHHESYYAQGENPTGKRIRLVWNLDEARAQERFGRERASRDNQIHQQRLTHNANRQPRLGAPEHMLFTNDTREARRNAVRLASIIPLELPRELQTAAAVPLPVDSVFQPRGPNRIFQPGNTSQNYHPH